MKKRKGFSRNISSLCPNAKTIQDKSCKWLRSKTKGSKNEKIMPCHQAHIAVDQKSKCHKKCSQASIRIRNTSFESSIKYTHGEN
jgi:hypothetical protein